MICLDCYITNLQFDACALGDRANTIVNLMKVGADYDCCLIEAALLQVMVSRMACVDPEHLATECLTEDEICDIMAYMYELAKRPCT
jgi:hypothetical protein